MARAEKVSAGQTHSDSESGCHGGAVHSGRHPCSPRAIVSCSITTLSAPFLVHIVGRCHAPRAARRQRSELQQRTHRTLPPPCAIDRGGLTCGADPLLPSLPGSHPHTFTRDRSGSQARRRDTWRSGSRRWRRSHRDWPDRRHSAAAERTDQCSSSAASLPACRKSEPASLRRRCAVPLS